MCRPKKGRLPSAGGNPASPNHAKIVFICAGLSNTEGAGTNIMGGFAVLTLESDDNSVRPIFLKEYKIFSKAVGSSGENLFFESEGEDWKPWQEQG